MGVYVYTLRSKVKNVEINGERAPVALLKYAYKVDFFAGSDDFKYHRMVATEHRKAEKAWMGKTMPSMIIRADDFKEGARVFSGWPAGCTSCYDDLPQSCKLLGILKKKGRRWIVAPQESK